MHGRGDLPLGVVEHVGTGRSLAEAQTDQECRILLLPSVSGRTGPVHVPEEPATHTLGIRVLSWQIDEGWRGTGVDLRIEVSPGYIYEADLRPVRGLSSPVWPMVADPTHSHAEHGPQGFDRRRRGEVALARSIHRLDLAGN